MRLPSQLAALCLAALAAAPAAARPFAVDDLLAAEEFGQVGFDPTGRWLVFERLRGQAASGPFDQDVYTGYGRARLYAVDLKARGPATPLLAPVPGEGHVAGPFSPDGARLVVLRLKGRDWEAGVVTLATREVTWLGITPELGLLGQTIAWRGDHELIMAARPQGDAPLRLRTGWQMRERQAALWAQAAAGETPAVAVIGSGRFREVRERAPGGGLLHLDLATGAARRLADGEFYDLEVSPDGREVAAMARLEDLQAHPGERLRVASPTRRRNLILVDLATGEAKVPCPDCDLTTHLMAWSPAGHEVLAYGRRSGELWSQARLVRLSRDGVRAAPMSGLSLSLGFTSEGYEIPPAAWLARDPVVYAAKAGQARSDWYRLSAGDPVRLTGSLAAAPSTLVAQDRRGLILAADGAVWRISAAGRAERLFDVASPAGRQGLSLSNRHRANGAPPVGWMRLPAANGASLAFRATDGRRVRIGAAGGRIVATALGPTAAAVVRRAPDGTMGLDLVETGGDARRLLTLNPDFAGIDFARILELRSRGPDGAFLSHWLILPKARPGGMRPALIVIPYPGATYAQPPEPYGRGIGRFSANAELLAAAGYAVLIPSLPRDPARLETGENIAAEILAVVDLAAATDLVDAERLAIFGHSFGGYSALMAATQSDRFKAVIASAAPSNLASVRGAFDPHHAVLPQDGLELNANYGWSELGQGNLGVSPWEDPARYQRNSPLFAVEQIKAPVLLIHGDGDFVRLAQAQEMFSALYRLNKDAQLITVFGEGHIVAGPANLRAVYGRVFDWLAKGLAAPAGQVDPQARSAPQP